MSKYTKLAVGLAMLASMTAQAAVMTVSGKQFDDRGNSMIDRSSGLEWMDFTPTLSRTTCSVIQDAGDVVPEACSNFDHADLIQDADGWRIATRAEAAQLLGNWFGVAVDLRSAGDVAPALAQQFLSVLADGAAYVRPNFFPDEIGQPHQAVGFLVFNEFDMGYYNMNFYNGGIDYTIVGTAMVRAAAAEVPEPGSLALLGLALPGLFMARRRRH